MWKDSTKELLYEEAIKGTRIRSSKHAACIIKKGELLSVGHNQLKTHPMMLKFSNNQNKVYLHAEIDAILNAIRRYGADILSGSDLYVLRLGKLNQIAFSKPCETCAKAIEAFGLNSYWTENET